MKHLLYLMGLIQLKVTAQTEQCPSSESQWSIPGWMLQRHIYKTMPSNLGLRCLVRCQADDRCQSFNFVLSRHICEFSDRTKEASPKDFIPDPDRFYLTRMKDRGKKLFVGVSIHSKRENGVTVIVVFTPARQWSALHKVMAHFQRIDLFPGNFANHRLTTLPIFFMFPVPLGSTPLLAAISCKEIKASEGEADSGKYWLSGLKPNVMVFVFCDMKTGGRWKAQFWQERQNVHKISSNGWIFKTAC